MSVIEQSLSQFLIMSSMDARIYVLYIRIDFLLKLFGFIVSNLHQKE